MEQHNTHTDHEQIAVTTTPDRRVSACEQATIAAVRASARSANTRRAYRVQWQRFASWCERRHAAPLPAAADLVAAYVVELGTSAKLATVRQAAAAIRSVHRAANLPAPTDAPAVRETLAGIARQHAANPATAPRQAAALAYDDAIRLLALARQPRTSGRGIESAAAAAARGQRDAAIVALLFCAGMRRSEVADLRWQDVEPTAKPGQLRVRVRRSKTNQDGQREDFRLLVNGFAVAVAALRDVSDAAPADPVIGLDARTINRRVQALAKSAGLDGVSAHSGRRGMATELVRRGASTTAIQQAGGWKDPQMVARYASAVSIEDGAIARYFG